MPLDQIDVDTHDEHEMSFLDHLEELRWHILRSVVAVAVIALACFGFQGWIFDTVIFGPRHPNFATYVVTCWLSRTLGLGNGICLEPVKFEAQTTEMGEAFLLSMTVSLVLGFIVAFPYVFWEFWRFISPGLRMSERRRASSIIFWSSLLFFIGVLFGYFVVAPFGINFLTGYEIPGVVNQPKLASYVNYLILFVLPMGIVFELPLLTFFLAQLSIVTAKLMRSVRRYAVVIILLVAGIITPGPDIVSQLLVGIPLYALYEVSIIVAMRVERRRRLAGLAVETTDDDTV